MSILSDGTIITELDCGQLKIINLENRDDQIQPASVDLRLASGITVQPGEFILASTIERVELPDYLSGVVCGRSSIGRLGLQVENAGFIDPGFKGTITLELINFSKHNITLYTGMKICQIAFHQLDFPALRPYGHHTRKSKYQDQSGVTESRLE